MMPVMTLNELQNAVNRRVDDVVIQSDLIDWLNAAKNTMAVEVKAKFPDLDPTNTTTFPFVFNDKYAELLILFAAARFKERDVMLDEARNYMNQFADGLKYFVEFYEPIMQYRDDAYSQQFQALAGQAAFVITKRQYDPQSGDLKVFVNGVQSTDFTIPAQIVVTGSNISTTATTTNDPRGFVFKPTTTLVQGDIVTATWDIHDDLQQPAYNWWNW